MLRSSAVASPASRRRWHSLGAVPASRCWRPARAWRRKRRAATAGTSTTGWPWTMPMWRPRSALKKPAPGTTPTTPRWTPWRGWCATKRSTATSCGTASSSSPRAPARWTRSNAARSGWSATAWTPRSRYSMRRACATKCRASASTAGCSTSAAARCTWAASPTAWPRPRNATARRFTPAPPSNASSAWARATRTGCTRRAAPSPRSRCCWPPAPRAMAATAASAGCAAASCRSAASSW